MIVFAKRSALVCYVLVCMSLGLALGWDISPACAATQEHVWQRRNKHVWTSHTHKDKASTSSVDFWEMLSLQHGLARVGIHKSRRGPRFEKRGPDLSLLPLAPLLVEQASPSAFAAYAPVLALIYTGVGFGVIGLATVTVMNVATLLGVLPQSRIGLGVAGAVLGGGLAFLHFLMPLFWRRFHRASRPYRVLLFFVGTLALISLGTGVANIVTSLTPERSTQPLSVQTMRLLRF